MATELDQLTDPLTADQIRSSERSLRTLQGNILKSHGRHHVALIFINFKDTPVKQIMSTIVELSNDLTSAWDQGVHALKKDANPHQFFRSFFLTWKGYERLGCVKAGRLGSLTDEAAAPFRDGMRRRAQVLGFDSKTEWKKPFLQESGEEIHAMYLLANGDQSALERERDTVRNELMSIFNVLRVEEGNQKLQSNKPIEHFGFRDGISQPLFFDSDMKKKGWDSNERWNPRAGPDLVLIKDPCVEQSDTFGSFLVLQKLEEKVSIYKGLEAEIAAGLTELNLSLAARLELAGAMIFGRFRDGTPLTLSGQPRGFSTDAELNNFDYRDDMPGRVALPHCPFRSHIRKANPREDHSLGDDHRNRRIARRSVSFEGAPGSGDPVGILFMCYQASIVRQFEFIQRAWLNPIGFPVPLTGSDAVVGRSGSELINRAWRAAWRPEIREDQNVKIDLQTKDIPADVVELLGGEYFFAPSLTFLTSLGSRH